MLDKPTMLDHLGAVDKRGEWWKTNIAKLDRLAWSWPAKGCKNNRLDFSDYVNFIYKRFLDWKKNDISAHVLIKILCGGQSVINFAILRFPPRNLPTLSHEERSLIVPISVIIGFTLLLLRKRVVDKRSLLWSIWKNTKQHLFPPRETFFRRAFRGSSRWNFVIQVVWHSDRHRQMSKPCFLDVILRILCSQIIKKTSLVHFWLKKWTRR